jgi:hypothetical protein
VFGPVDGVIVEGDHIMLVLRVDQKVAARLIPVDFYGNPARIDGVPAWTLSDDGLATVVEIAPDGLSAKVIPTGLMPPEGSVLQVQVAGDADLGEGVRTITTTADIQLEAGEAMGFSIAFGAPEPK